MPPEHAVKHIAERFETVHKDGKHAWLRVPRLNGLRDSETTVLDGLVCGLPVQYPSYCTYIYMQYTTNWTVDKNPSY